MVWIVTTESIYIVLRPKPISSMPSIFGFFCFLICAIYDCLMIIHRSSNWYVCPWAECGNVRVKIS